MHHPQKLRVELIQYCADFIDNQINHIQEEIQSAKLSAQAESKSSAGDKHETSKSLLQLSQENNASLLANLWQQKPVIQQLAQAIPSECIGLGSIIDTDNGIYFIAIGIGAVKLNNNTYFVISPTAPVGKLCMGKKAGDTIVFRENRISILGVL